MKRILIAGLSMRSGGIESALINLLKNIDYSKYHIDLFLWTENGDYYEDIPKEVHVFKGNRLFYCISNSFRYIFNSHNLINIFIRVICMVLVRIIGNNQFFRLIVKTQKKMLGYDIAISFFHDSNTVRLYRGCNHFVIYRVQAKRKLTWIHSDLVMGKLDTKQNEKIFELFDAVCCISKACKDQIDHLMPRFTNKTFVIYNMFSIQEIREKAMQKPNDLIATSKKVMRFITVARLDVQSKALERIIHTSYKLNNEGIANYEWLIIGDGPDRDSLLSLTRNKQVEANIKFIGYRKNPYPYLASADAFVLSSKYEGYPMVVNEALILGIPVITTEYAAAHEQIIHGVDGIICENSLDGIYNTIKKVIVNKNIVAQLKSNLSKIEISNYVALEQFKNVIEYEQ